MICIDTKDFIDLACDRLQKVYNVDNFELKVFEKFINDFLDNWDIENFNKFIDDFHKKGYHCISKAKFEKEKQKCDYFIFSNEDEEQYAMIYPFY